MASMASCSQSMISASTSFLPTHRIRSRARKLRGNDFYSSVKASSEQDVDCNEEDCAPEKESLHCLFAKLPSWMQNLRTARSLRNAPPLLHLLVGKVSVEWLASEKTTVIGTYPPLRKKGWTGYVEKDTAGQTNIYSVEPTVYVAESVISSGSAGSSADGSGNTIAVVAGLALASIASASLILSQVGKGTPHIKTTEYSGPSLSYYINKFKQPQVVEASIPQGATAAILEDNTSEGASQLQVGTASEELTSTVS